VATNTPIAILGPTAVGKSAIAEAVALTLHGEIVNADSMQVYRRMDVGTAKTPASERHVGYHCIDLVEPGEPYSAALYQRDARRAIDDIVGRGVVPILVGGTGLYLRAALDEFVFPAGELAGETRRVLEERVAVEGAAALHEELARLDPASAALIHPNNVRRTVRALEMRTEGRSYAQQTSEFSSRTFHYPGTRLVGLTMERDALYARIDSRVDRMMAEGLLAEVEALLADGYRNAITAAQAIGYKELVPVIDGVAPLDEAVVSIKQSTRRYAKRQLTWFRADPRIAWVDVTGLSPDEALGTVLDLLESAEH